MKLFMFLFVLTLLASNSAFALQCKTGNDSSDECWTTGQAVTSDVGQLIAGTIMVYDFTTGVNEGNDADDAAFYVRTASSTDQLAIVAGVLQKTYASSDRVQLLVRGKGKIRAGVTTVSGDRLYIVAGSVQQRGIATNVKQTFASADFANIKPVGFALTSEGAATKDAYITVI